jgi:U3 small nucleolar RNA-associated protein 3
MGQKRRTAKTGDKAINKSRAQEVTKDNGNSHNDDDDDPMYNEVDRFHNDKDKDFLMLDRNNDDDDADSDDGLQEEAVMDLGLGGVDDDDDDDSSSNEDSSDVHDDDDDGDHSEEEDEMDGEAAPLSASDDEGDDDDDAELNENVRDWGRRKSSYYHGDTADLEIGQDENDAILEEEAAKEVQAARFKDMTEDDFVLSDNDDDEEEKNLLESAQGGGQDVVASRDLSKRLSLKLKRKLLDKQHPELLPLVAHFSTMVADLHAKTSVASQAIFFGEQGTADVRCAAYLDWCVCVCSLFAFLFVVHP